MLYEKNNWSFGGENTLEFDEHVNSSVPMYNEFHNEIINMSCFFAQKNSKIIDIGTSTGILINKLKENNKEKNIDFVGIDIEEDMIKECKKRYDNIDFFNIDAIDFDYTNSSIITSVLTLQFINIKDRKRILNKIYNQLNDGGVLFVVEKVRTDIPLIHDIYNDLYYDFKLKQFTSDEIMKKNQSLRGIMNPLTVNENIEMFKEAGFEKIDIFMKINNFVGFIIIK